MILMSVYYIKFPEVRFDGYSIVQRGQDHKMKFEIDPPQEYILPIGVPIDGKFETSFGNLYISSLKLWEWRQIEYLSGYYVLYDGFEQGIRLPLEGDWHTTTQYSYRGNYSLRSNKISHRESTDAVMRFKLDYETVLSFRYMVRSEAGFDFFEFYINDSRLIRASGSGSWTEFKRTLAPGEYTVIFRYLKDYSVDRLEDCVFIDDFELFQISNSKLLVGARGKLYSYNNGWKDLGNIPSNNEQIADLMVQEGLNDVLHISLNELKELGEEIIIYVLTEEELNELFVSGVKDKGFYYKTKLDEIILDKDWINISYTDVVEVEKTIPLNYFITSEKEYKFVVELMYGEDLFTFEKGLWLYNTDHKIDIKMEGLQLFVTIQDFENDSLRYKVLLNDQQIYPVGGREYTDFIGGGHVEYNRLFLSSDLRIGELNTITVVAEDIFGRVVSNSYSFEAQYMGLMFADMSNEFYSTDLGEVLKYLEIGPLMAGTSSLIYPIKLINKYPFDVTNITLWQDARDRNDIIIELSETEVPFVGKDRLNIDKVMKYNDEIVFYVRVSSKPSAMQGGLFDIYAKADPLNKSGG